MPSIIFLDAQWEVGPLVFPRQSSDDPKADGKFIVCLDEQTSDIVLCFGSYLYELSEHATILAAVRETGRRVKVLGGGMYKWADDRALRLFGKSGSYGSCSDHEAEVVAAGYSHATIMASLADALRSKASRIIDDLD